MQSATHLSLHLLEQSGTQGIFLLIQCRCWCCCVACVTLVVPNTNALSSTLISIHPHPQLVMQASDIWCRSLHCNGFTTNDSCLNRMLCLQINYDQALGSSITPSIELTQLGNWSSILGHSWHGQLQRRLLLLCLLHVIFHKSQIPKGWSLVATW